MTMCTSARHGEGARSRYLALHIKDHFLYVQDQVPGSAEQPLRVGRFRYTSCRASAEQQRHDQHGPAQLGRDGVTSLSRMPTSSTTWATSTLGRPSSTRSSRVLTMLFGRLEALLELRGGQIGL